MNVKHVACAAIVGVGAYLLIKPGSIATGGRQEISQAEFDAQLTKISEREKMAPVVGVGVAFVTLLVLHKGFA